MTITNTYLTNPEWSPVAGDDPACGAAELYIDFVGGPYHVLGLNNQQEQQIRKHFAEACVTEPPNKNEAVDIHVYRAPEDSFHLPDPFPLYRTFELDAQQNQVRVAGENLYAVIDLGGTISGHLWTIEHEEYFHSNTFENFFRMLVTYRLMESGGMLLHSAGVVNRDEAFLFPGRSDDGKSTLSRLSIEEGRSVLSDDMNAVTWHDGHPYVEKVPFTGDLKRTWTRSSSYPLKALFAIRKATATSISELSPARTLTLLTSCTPYINADAHRMSQLLENLYRLTEKVPAHILEFSLSGDIWDTIEASIANQ
jgi:hypothetical protein